MAYVQADRVQETTTTTGTGTVTLAGAVAGYRTFGSQMVNGDTCYYVIFDPATNAWETGIGTYSSGTLARTTLLDSSTGSVVSFGAGTKNVLMAPVAKGALLAPASTAAQPAMRCPAGTAPTSPADGDVWFTSAGMWHRRGGTTYGPFLAPAAGALVHQYDAGSPGFQLRTDAAAGYQPPTIQFTRQGVGGGATPSNSTISLFRWDGKDSSGSYDLFAAIQVDIGTNAAGGAPSVMLLQTAPSGGNATNALQLGSDQAATFYGSILPMAGTTSKAPVTLSNGSLKTTPAQGDVEWDGDNLFITGDVTNGSGREVNYDVQRVRLQTAVSSIAAGTDFFPSLRPMMKSGRLYHFKYFLSFNKVTTGTVTWQLKNSAAANFTSILAEMRILPTGGTLAAVGNVMTAAASAAATATFPASQSLTAGVFHAFVEGYCVPASNTRLSIVPSAYGAGSISTIAGSMMMIADLGDPSVNHGNLG